MAPYRKLRFPQYPQWTAVVAKFTEVPTEVLDQATQRIFAGETPLCVLNTTYLILTRQLEYAIYKTVQHEEYGTRKAKTLATEIFANLLPDKNIGEALRRFGVNTNCDQVVTVLLLHHDHDNNKTIDEMIETSYQEMKELLGGLEPVEIVESEWWSSADLTKVRKVYKLNDAVGLDYDDQEAVTELVIGACIMRTA